MREQNLGGKWQFRQAGTIPWLAATVPGGVHTDLRALGLIPDPFFGDNELRVQWVAESDWEYRKTFRIDPPLRAEKKTFLVCDGLDTLAEVTLNGRLLGKTDNQFRAHRFDLSGLLKDGENDLTVFFRSPLAFIRARQAERPLTGGGDIPGGPHLRKSPYHWGWDWGPKLPAIGIWKDIRLEGCSVARLDDVRIRQHHTEGNVRICLRAAVQTFSEQTARVRTTLIAPDGSRSSAEAPVERGAAEIAIDVERPRLWWPSGMGAQNLYQLEVLLEADGILLDRKPYRLGLRTIALKREPDSWGESFTFAVNGVPLFAKGADWIPADSFTPRVSGAHMRALLQSAVDANMNMLRVWGGGTYGEERFYDWCDELGILVWQDFIFACGIYPDDDAFAENVRIEAVENIRRLRHRASLALWCGNNEMEQGWSDWKWNKPDDPDNQRLKAGYDRMFHHLIPAVVAEEDPDRPYWPSSASSGEPFSDPNGQRRGDMHYWGVWHERKPFTAYREQFPRFASEFGFQSLPPFKTIKAFTAPADRNLTSYVMEHRQRSGPGNRVILSQMLDTFRMPKDFPALVYLSMILQAEGMRIGVEHWRRHRARVGGTIIWQLNDCWPAISWASLDYFGRWKATHYAAKRFYAPVLLSIEDTGEIRGVHVTSDLTEAWQGEVRWRLETTAGKMLDQGREKVVAAPSADTAVCAPDFSGRIVDANRRNVVLVCELWRNRTRIATCVSPFAPIKHLALENPGLKAKVGKTGGGLSIEVSAKTLALFVELALNGADAVFSDNFFDLPAGASARITAPLPQGWTLARARKALRIRSLADSY
ncbi:MAG: glycoside hydrolase family 2 protein [Anaerolineales bacterium]|nr:glycoside hydrolase family 2 protein [Anaerolineales bacterium]